MSRHSDYKPAAGRHLFTSLYDPMMALTMRESSWRPALVAAVADGAPQRVLEVGSGTGSLTVELKKALPRGQVDGIDPDPDARQRSLFKAESAGVEISIAAGTAEDLPFENDSFDAVVISLVLHHLRPEQKRVAVAEMWRVLRPGGSLVVADWGPPHNSVQSAAFLMVQLLDGFETTRDHRRRSAGWWLQDGESGGCAADVNAIGEWATMWGRLELVTASLKSQGG